MLHAQIYTEKRKSERNWLFTPPLTIYKRTAIRRLPTARNSKTVSFFRRWQQCSSSFCIWSREPRCGGFCLTSGSKSKNSLKTRIVEIYNCFILVAKPLYVLRFWAWGRILATAQRHALEREKKNGYTVASDGENLHVLEFFAVGNKGKAVPFLFCQG